MRSVQHTGELDRILRLPKRDGSYERYIDPLSAFLRKEHVCPGDTCAGGVTRLLLPQTTALVDAHDHGGLFFQGPIGSGKTLVSFLLPTVFEVKRPLLVIPGGSIVEKTIEDLRRYREHWRIPAIEIRTYEFLQNENNANFFWQYRPDLFVFDESHKLKSWKAAVHRRAERFHEEFPAVPMCFMSGTPAKRSIADIQPPLAWALNDACPLPVVPSDLRDWGAAVDAGVKDFNRMDFGALRTFGNNMQSVRRGLRDRIFSTPGAVASDKIEVDAKLEIRLVNVELSPQEDEHYLKLYEDWETPDGHEFSDAKDLWRYERQLARGFFNVWSPRPPKPWLDARKEWYHGVREFLSRARKIDTEKQVASYVDSHPGHHLEAALAQWRLLKKTFVPNAVPTWTGDTALLYAASWAKDGGIIWTEHVAFGARLSAMTGIPYFGQEGKTADGRHSIVTYQGSVMIASWEANGTGHNLQRYDRGLITSMWPTATVWDQTLGRQHRQGQKSAIVHFDVMIACRQDLVGFERASQDDGPFHRDLLAIPSRLVEGNITSDRLTQRGHAWTVPKS